MNKLRMELQELLRTAESRRPAALRRSLREEFLYAADLPRAAGEQVVRAFCRRAEAAGWCTETQDGWIQLDRECPDPPEGGFDGPFGPEAACCQSLLARHPEKQRGTGNRERRMLIKAGEEGPEAYERVCAQLHREWAARLRAGEKLPEIRLSYFEGGGKNADQAYRACGISDGDGERSADSDRSV